MTAYTGPVSTIQTIILKGESLNYELELNPRTRSLGLRLYRDGRLVVVAPRDASVRRVEAFLMDKQDWILRKRALFAKKSAQIQKLEGTYEEYKLMALELATSRLHYFNRRYGFTFKRITIKQQKTRWGSCSQEKNLNFHYRIALIPPELADYLVVHELCHLGQMNHSEAFWALVERTIPDYKERRKRLKLFSLM